VLLLLLLLAVQLLAGEAEEGEAEGAAGLAAAGVVAELQQLQQQRCHQIARRAVLALVCVRSLRNLPAALDARLLFTRSPLAAAAASSRLILACVSAALLRMTHETLYRLQ
jgi:hypothetical protein